jgi:hypothetical protein
MVVLKVLELVLLLCKLMSNMNRQLPTQQFQREKLYARLTDQNRPYKLGI